jgi:hypothetical protein
VGYLRGEGGALATNRDGGLGSVNACQCFEERGAFVEEYAVMVFESLIQQVEELGGKVFLF